MQQRTVDVLAGAGDTWGIPGRTFLVLYLLAAAGLTVVALLARRSIRRNGAAPRELHPYEAAYLKGGPPRAVAAALAALRFVGAVESAGGGRVRVTDGAQARTARSPLDDAVHEAIRESGGIKVAALGGHDLVVSALKRLRDGLERDGQALTESERAQMHWAVLPLWALTALGVVRIVAGSLGDRPVAFLIAATIAVAVLAAVLNAVVPALSEAGWKSLVAAEKRYRHLDPERSPSWATYGATGVGLGVALFGTTALMSLDPAFAEETEIHRKAASDSGSGGGDGGGCGGGGGGCGGCGGCGG
ncbi:MAG TPA: TIGR04222 domain-containing membrane protein [Thermomonospora sp.]|nr:TIGR04222 domain-containing membrane protein [Thermomonospora sp.]